MAHWKRRGGKGAAWVASLAAHATAVAVLLVIQPPPKLPPETPPVVVSLVEPPPPPPPPPSPPAPHEAPKSPVKAPKTPPSPEMPKDAAQAAPRSPLRVTKAPVPPDVIPLPASPKPAPARVMGLGEAELMGAATAGPGSGGGGGGAGCDMVRLLQEGLRKNPRARASLMRTHAATVGAGRAPLVWNGDWLRADGEAGDGLSGLREMIMLEVAFAPAACRAEPMRGLVLISLNDGPGAARFALGGGHWRWSDLLFAKGARR
ncbi:hypothetical protein EIB18_12970 [Caulobacter vibrioides]|nr:hypothetical protein [Caulobacter vibrioides]YP_002517904.2 proline-rich hypothetical protein [Caulobacter vibrioides NA1000]QBQ57270.1 hypothetical protein EUX21_02735 [synthetic Caulobacter sp. 'ethensis']ACL95996.2 proline-rich hypothetical protein [Caulobacter vibrioides NA1000]ATC30680.1 hypothetical protein CA607_13265 [Caulobacter vibrioides]AZH14832.1 hypothetical protein EIB18_12970 [Caulobacter vibrioides]QXZ53994.1 hypothetical protein KZH45_13025 [Caulobacter vibrioides]